MAAMPPGAAAIAIAFAGGVARCRNVSMAIIRNLISRLSRLIQRSTSSALRTPQFS